MINQPTRVFLIRQMAILLALCVLGTTAVGQSPRGAGPGRPGGQSGGSASMEHLLRPDYRARDMAILASQLELDHSQRPIFEMLLEDYREAFREAAYDLDRALRHMRLQQTQEFMERRLERQRRREEGREQGRAPVNEISIPAELVVVEGGEFTVFIKGDSNELSGYTERMNRAEAEDQQVVTLSTENSPYAERVEFAAAPGELHPRFRAMNDDDRDDDGEGSRDRPEMSPQVQERINRMRDRIRRRIEERLEQQREEMRQRGIDPDEEIEPMEPEAIAEIAETLLAEKARLRTRFESGR